MPLNYSFDKKKQNLLNERNPWWPVSTVCDVEYVMANIIVKFYSFNTYIHVAEKKNKKIIIKKLNNITTALNLY